MKNNFSPQIKKAIYEKQNGVCALHKNKFCLKNKFLSFHHIVENTKTNIKIFGMRLQREENGVILCEFCHANYRHLFRHIKNRLKKKWLGEIKKL